MTPIRLGVLVSVVLLGAACVSAPARREPDLGVTVPDRWLAEANLPPGIVASDWWKTFDDAALDAVVSEALDNNYDIRAAAARVEAAGALAKIAGADLVPSVDFDLGGSRQNQNFVGLPVPGAGVPSATFSSYGVSLSTFWEVDLWGRIRSGAEAAVADMQASQALYHGVRLSVAGQAAKAWFAVGEARRQVALSEETVEAFRDTTERVRTRWERGIRPSLDYRLSLANLAGAEANLEQRRNRLQLTTRQLEVLLGRYPEDAIAGSEDLPPPPDDVPAGLPANLVSRRPDLVVAERLLSASGARVSQARAALYPRLALTAAGGTTSDELGDLLDGDFSVWSIAANLFQPLFQGGRLRAGVRLAEANEEQAVALYVQDVLLAYGEVESILAAESILQREERALDTAAVQSVAARALAEDRYDNGIEDIITVLDSQRRALVAESSLLEVRRERLENRIDLYLALGGGFDTDEVDIADARHSGAEASP
jgi:NodT family efflux transporter outer membrane factor (OMF) lipoprotein